VRKFGFVAFILILIQSYIPLSVASVPSAGSKCSKAGMSQNYQGKKFTCIKSGKKLVWSIGVVITNPSVIPISPVPSQPTPSQLTPSASPTPFKPRPLFSPSPLQTNDPRQLSSTSAAPGRFCLNEESQSAFGNEFLVCKKGVWTRALGYRIIQTPTPTQTYNPKYGNISEKELANLVLADWAQWKKKKLNNQAQITIILQDGYAKDWETVTREVTSYAKNVLDGNGLKLTQTPFFAYGDTEDFRSKAFAQFYKTSSCTPPYMANSEEGVYCATAGIGSGGVRIGKPGFPVANNYQLTKQDLDSLTFFIAHEIGIFYIVQAQYGDISYTGNKFQIPTWIRQGTAQMIGVLVANDLRNSGGLYLDQNGFNLFFGPKPETICSKDLQDAESKEKFMPDNCSQSMSFYAVSLLVSKFGGIKALFKFFALYGQNDDWVNDFKLIFGISREDFYKEWWTYLGVTQGDWPDFQPPSLPERY
jgi:hypothetical protein